MIKRLRKVGNSSAILLDRAIMDMVGIGEDAEVQVTVSGGSIIVTPANPAKVDPAEFERCLKRVVSRRRSALKRLAE